MTTRTKTRVQTGLVAAVVAAVAAAGVVTGTADAQKKPEVKPSKVGLIDMARVFQDYWKFENQREDLKAEMISMDASAKPKMEELQQLSKQIKENVFKTGTPERDKAESRLFELSSELEALRKKAQVDVMRKESEIYKDIYLEVQQTVGRFSQYYGYDMVIRFNSNKLEETTNPQAVLQQMNRQVVHHNPKDDITQAIIDYLNDRYQKAGGSEPAAK